MAKYVCDFDVVTSVGTKMGEISSSITSSINTYSSSIGNDLSTWTGNAKSSFETTNNKQIETSKEVAKFVNEKGEFILKVAKSIEALESELSSLKI